MYDNPELLDKDFDLEESNPINKKNNTDEEAGEIENHQPGDDHSDAFTDPSVEKPTIRSAMKSSNSMIAAGSSSPYSRSAKSPNGMNSSKKTHASNGSSIGDAVGEALSPRRKLAREREKTEKKVVRYVQSPVPYVVVVMLLIMIIMVFVDVMPIASLICLASILMVLVVVLGNHWRNKVIWEMENEYDYYYQPLLAGAPAAIANRENNDKPINSAQTEPHALSSQTYLAPAATSVGYKRDHSKSYRHHRAPSNASMITKDGIIMDEERESDMNKKNLSHHHHQHHRKHSHASHHSRSSSLQLEVPTDGNQGDKTMLAKQMIEKENFDAELESLGPMTKEDRLDNLNEFFDAMFGSIDYSLLLIFLGTFIVVENMSSTGIPRQIW